MYTKLVVLFAFVCSVVSRDVSIGRSAGRKIFDEIRQANPAIWRQIENVTIIAPSDEVISGVVITDMRPDKDGDAQIVDGGEGKDRVTIELKSPTVLRGYEFHLEVYTESSTKYSDGEENLMAPADESNSEPEIKQSTTLSDSEGSGDQSTSEMPMIELNENSDKDAPSAVGKDLNENIRSARRIDEEVDYDATENLAGSSTVTTEMTDANSTAEPPENIAQDAAAIIGQESSENVRPSSEANENGENDRQINNFDAITSDAGVSENAEEANMTDLTENSDNDARILVSDIARPSREAGDVDNFDQTDSADNFNVPSVVASDASTTEFLEKDESTTEINVKTTVEEEVTSAPVMLDNSKNIPDYSSLDILDMIKEKEGTRRIRHTEDNNNEQPEMESNDNATTELNPDSENSEASTDASVKTNDDDIIDLMPPEIDASYNTQFSDSVESGVPKSDDVDNSSTTELSEQTNVENNENVSTTDSSLEEQSRNARYAASTDIDAESNNLQIPSEPQEKVTCNSGVGSKNIIILNGDALTGDGTKLRYEIPIVLVLANGNFPTIKIILEDNTSEEKPGLDNTQPEGGMAKNPEINEEMSKIFENTDEMTSEDDYLPKPVMLMEN